MLQDVRYCRKMNKKYFIKSMRFKKKNLEDFETPDKCHICNKKYTEDV